MRALTLALLLGTACAASAVDVTNLPPSCAEAFVSPDALWPPNHRLVPLAIDGVVDPENDPVALTITAIAQDEPADGSGSCPDASGVGTGVAAVRAERDGSGDGRVYHVAFRASDPGGASCDGEAVVCVRHDNGKGTVCGDQGPLYDSTAGACRPPDDGSDDDYDYDCDAACAPPPPVFDCDVDALPRGIARRMVRAQRLLTRAEAAGPKKQRRLTRRASGNLARIERLVAGRRSLPCPVAYDEFVAWAETCRACLEYDHQDDDRDDD